MCSAVLACIVVIGLFLSGFNSGIGICNSRPENPGFRRIFIVIAQLLSIIVKYTPF